MKNKYITEIQRYNIELLLKENYPIKEIAEKIGKSLKTIYNEVKRGMVTLLNSELVEYTVYLADVAQRRYDEMKKKKGRPLKVGNDMEFVRYFEDKVVNEKYSPCATMYHAKNEGKKFKTSVCIKTLYNYIHKGIFLNITEKEMSYRKKKKSPSKPRCKVSLNNIKGRTIEARPKEAMGRDIFGHWEMDTVVSGKSGKACLLVLTERSTRHEIICKAEDRTQRSIIKALDELETRMGYTHFRDTFKTITCDNGVEFLGCKEIEKSCLYNKKRTELYYCHPYSAFERGSNENANKLIRRWIPKGADISAYSKGQIKKIQDWINLYPRKLFDGLSSHGRMLAKYPGQAIP